MSVTDESGLCAGYFDWAPEAVALLHPALPVKIRPGIIVKSPKPPITENWSDQPIWSCDGKDRAYKKAYFAVCARCKAPMTTQMTIRAD